MRIVKADAKYIDQSAFTPYECIERAGRTCYKSENNIADGSAVKFVGAMIRNNHTAMLEHSHMYMLVTASKLTAIYSEANAEDILRFMYITYTDDNKAYISGNCRAWVEMLKEEKLAVANSNLLLEMKVALAKKYPEMFIVADEMKDLPVDGVEVLSRDEFISSVKENIPDPFMAEQAFLKHLVHTVVFTCDRGVTHEFVRHRIASFAQESTRYCNYSQDKFSNEIAVIDPCFWEKDSDEYKLWKEGCEATEKVYFELLEKGATAQQARDVLPTSLKTEIVITATESEWQHIINLRLHGTTGSPHPQIVEVMEIAMPELVKASEGRLK